MLLSKDKIALFTAACADRNNQKAAEVMNLLGTGSGMEIVRLVAALPGPMRWEIEKQVHEAIAEQKRRDQGQV
jgi:hypothetical protein